MYSFKNDYSEGAHPRILQAMMQTNLQQQDGYGEDSYSQAAQELLKQRLGQDVDIHFMPGGTQTNFTAISSFLRPHEAVISADTGHICVHETGAVEATGHKIIAMPEEDGKLTPARVQAALDFHLGDEHMVRPKLVYISNSTEVGTIYSQSELKQLSDICHENGLFLYMDGARLGSALTAEGNGLKLADIPQLVDAFYIGGTKNGAMIGEALVICRQELKEDFRYLMKQRGAMLAKGRLLGLQFQELFRDELYFDLAQRANNMAGLLRRGIEAAGYKFLNDSPSNQICPVLPNRLSGKLGQGFSFYVWSQVDSKHSAIRLVASWATQEDAVRSFIASLK